MKNVLFILVGWQLIGVYGFYLLIILCFKNIFKLQSTVSDNSGENLFFPRGLG